ncbi:UDP-glucose 4-epimerase [Planococcus glaciei]|uniref:UDP-glucose 4-epimerase GalE n=1 Tax=Planococcus glaciei TaxID=459472 RepID=UPI00088E14A2|nr:UDP-glucose 4-epimerase GalE [Planococcus glaciei]SDI36238.1 UDP-glucose 4-epimerase [Planococcus glaciei]
MKILLTGGAGYIGSHAAVELLDQGYEIVIMDNLSNSNIECLERIKEITGKSFAFYKVDLLEYDLMNQIFKEHSIDAVIHFAGLKSVGESVKAPLDYYLNNISGTVNLCSLMKKHGVNKMVFSSTAAVYGNPDRVPIDESFPVSPASPYGRSKLMIEEILRDVYHSDPSWRIAILRYFNPIGAHHSGRIGEDPNGIPDNLVPYITQVAVGKREKLQVFGNDYDTPDGTGVRDYIHVVDLVKGHLKALEYIEKKKGIEVINLGTGTGYSVLEIIGNFREVTGRPVDYQITARRPGDPGVTYANPKKAEIILGWKAEKNLKDMCQDSWNWQSRNPDGYHSALLSEA